VPVELFSRPAPEVPADVARVMQQSLEIPGIAMTGSGKFEAATTR
jgi:hypothetical protein